MPDLVQIQGLVNDALKLASQNKHLFKNDPVNWADLRCTDVEWCVSVHENQYLRVTISEAAPNCKLTTFIRDYLQGTGPDIEVISEW